jgi:hypothetical protein
VHNISFGVVVSILNIVVGGIISVFEEINVVVGGFIVVVGGFIVVVGGIIQLPFSNINPLLQDVHF